MVAAAGKETNHMPPFSRIMDEVVSDLPFIQVGSGMGGGFRAVVGVLLTFTAVLLDPVLAPLVHLWDLQLETH